MTVIENIKKEFIKFSKPKFLNALYKFLHKFDFVCTVHRNQLYKQTYKMQFLYVFITHYLYNSTCFERPFHSSSEVLNLLYLQFCTNHANVSNCSVYKTVTLMYMAPFIITLFERKVLRSVHGPTKLNGGWRIRYRHEMY